MSLRGVNHIVLKVKDLSASDHFYREVLGMQRVGERPGMWFYRAGGHHHDLALVEAGPEAQPPKRMNTGLFYFCLDVSDEPALAELYKHCEAAGVSVLGAVDHTVSRGFYVQDPDGHVVELGVDVPAHEWADVDNPFAHDREYSLSDKK